MIIAFAGAYVFGGSNIVCETVKRTNFDYVSLYPFHAISTKGKCHFDVSCLREVLDLQEETIENMIERIKKLDPNKDTILSSSPLDAFSMIVAQIGIKEAKFKSQSTKDCAHKRFVSLEHRVGTFMQSHIDFVSLLQPRVEESAGCDETDWRYKEHLNLLNMGFCESWKINHILIARNGIRSPQSVAESIDNTIHKINESRQNIDKQRLN